MPKIHRIVLMSAFALVIAVLASGCYTIVGYPPEVEKSIIEEEAAGGHVYRDYEYYYDHPYSYHWDYYSPYHSLWYPYSYHPYSDYPWWYYSDRYRWNYGDQYVPQKKRETRRRGTFEFPRTPRLERKSGGRLEEDEERKQPSREIQSRRKAEDTGQRSIRKHRDTASGSETRSTRRKPQDEEEK